MFDNQDQAGDTLVNLSDLERGQTESFLTEIVVDQNDVTVSDSTGRTVTLAPGLTLEETSDAVRAVIPGLRPPRASDAYPDDLSPHMQWTELLRDCGAVIHVLYPQLLLLRIQRGTSQAVIVVTDGANNRSTSISLDSDQFATAVLDDIKYQFFQGGT